MYALERLLAWLLLLVPPFALWLVPVTPLAEVERSTLVMHGDVLERDGLPFSGWIVEREGEAVIERTPVLAGRAEGTFQRFYPDGSLRAEGRYVHGHREGEHRVYWPDGSLQSVRRYHQDRFEGEQLAFHRDGRPAERLHYEGGHEEGTQEVWEPDGQLRVNYSVVGGRRYGIVGRMDCVTPRMR